MHFVISPDSLLFCSVTASVAAAFGLFLLYRLHADRGGVDATTPAARFPPVIQKNTSHSRSRLLPPFMYNRLVRHSGKGASSTECAVCLSVIQVGAMVKLLPACTHVYHVDCIDLWLASHWTCPVCRCRVDDHSNAGQVTVQHVALVSPA